MSVPVFDLRLQCWCFSGEECICGDEEKVLRHYAYSSLPIQAMTKEQRGWCVQEADSAAEGALKRSDLEAMSDRELAAATLNAWNDYARSQGL